MPAKPSKKPRQSGKKRPKTAEKRPKNAAKRPVWIVSTLPEVAAIVGRHRQSVLDWSRQWPAECRVAGGGYDVVAIVQWVLSRRDSPVDVEVEERRRAARIQREREEIKLRREQRDEEIERGEWVKLAEINADHAAGLRWARDRLLNIPATLIPILGKDGAYVADLMREKIDGTLHECADQLNLNGKAKKA